MKNIFKFIFLIILFNKINCSDVEDGVIPSVLNPLNPLFDDLELQEDGIVDKDDEDKEQDEISELFEDKDGEKDAKIREQNLLEKLTLNIGSAPNINSSPSAMSTSSENLSSNSGKIVEEEMESDQDSSVDEDSSVDQDSSSMNDDKERKMSLEKLEENATHNLSQEDAQEINAYLKSLSDKKYNLKECENDLKELIDILFKITFQHYKNLAEQNLPELLVDKRKGPQHQRKNKSERILGNILSIFKTHFGHRYMKYNNVRSHLEKYHNHVYKVFEAILKLIQEDNSDSANDTMRRLWYNKQINKNHKKYI